MQKARLVHGWTGKQVAAAFGCDPARISRVERGTMPSRPLVQFYDYTFECEGYLLSIYEAALTTAEQERQRARGRQPRLHFAVPGDASEFVDDTVPHGTLLGPGQLFVKTWRIRNRGSVPWSDRRLERQGPLTAPGLIASLRHYPIPDTRPGAVASISASLKAPTYDCASIAYFKMIDAQGRLSFPDSYQLGLDVLVLVRGQRPDLGLRREAADIEPD